MSNRYCNLTPTIKIKDDFANISTGFDRVQAEMDVISRQVLINGSFDVWQRGTSINASGGLQYLADRWCAYNTIIPSQTMTISKQDGSGVPGSVDCLRFQRNSGQTGVNTIYLAQSLETRDSKKFLGKKLTLSFWARIGTGTVQTSLQATIRSGTGTDQNLLQSFTGETVEASVTATANTVWQKFTVTMSGVLTGKSQVAVMFSYTPLGTAGASDYFEIAQIQLCAGDVALPHQPRSFAEELALCQRYYEKSYNYAKIPGASDSDGAGAEVRVVPNSTIPNGQKYGTVSFKVKKRTISPTVIAYPHTNSANTGRVSDATSGADLAAGSGSVAISSESGFLPWNASGGNISTTNAVVQFHWSADAEL